jgi:hypothetical protein
VVVDTTEIQLAAEALQRRALTEEPVPVASV